MEARTLPLHSAESLSSDSNACRYQAFPSRVVSLIIPMLSEQTVDAYLWWHAAFQVDLYYIFSITPNLRDGLLIRLPSSLTARPTKL
ncbi:unnamed protein product [Protopolystoma xenopodis]|uniref:Uncharacterized protein n=1 Tax=Protopolystoma xenopodis TaxID=117903 RepID=A0A3S5AWD3_9PLAT|nr:unnamed protein product [Protopolystoma xenopodis]